jgi:hypothetical protein
VPRLLRLAPPARCYERSTAGQACTACRRELGRMQQPPVVRHVWGACSSMRQTGAKDCRGLSKGMEGMATCSSHQLLRSRRTKACWWCGPLNFMPWGKALEAGGAEAAP